MTAPLGTRTCPNLGCGRRIHVSASGTVYARCLAHTLMLVSGAFAVQPPERAREMTPRVSRVLSIGSPVAAGSRPR